MPTLHARTEILLGQAALKRLRHAHILIAGIGGVGGYVAENLARAGIGALTLLDKDIVSSSNLNRQIMALRSTLGKKKTTVMKARIIDIDPTIKINVIDDFMAVEDADRMVLSGDYDVIADCIDTIACKAQLVYAAQKHHIPIISAMGAGNRVDATRVRVSRLDKTQSCPLAREMRRRLRELGADLKYPVVYTDEPRRQPFVENIGSDGYREKVTNGTISYMPAIFGLLMAGEIVNWIIKDELNIKQFDTDCFTRS
ncbi:MAG: tRNA threonylcarbamoyladenosine dehydratase [Gammaproteobacteria bacterium]|nr:MAG: tRNA threonylcarbamoyladenosine dehydratase [Gammaproteobacteria bacterium]